ncbi:unnamed protein product [Symbiodinium natans]|uniref:Apple domain-containing protein n=1 Tax=Symbiodinium natans TaxID=878477 RepID=A0A812J3I5_9DINO|nr:unnamed protein product [Symbiodinium natans]
MWSKLLVIGALCKAVHGGECQRGQGQEQCNSGNAGPTLLQYGSRVRQPEVVSTDTVVPACAPFEEWPHVDNGVTCGAGSCRALVETGPYGGVCDVYCASFGHKCVAAAEEKAETCEVLEQKRCDEEIAGTSDMLCTCKRSEEVCWDGVGGLVDDEGNEVGQLEAATLEECESSCNADDACKSITFCQKWGTCFLKDRSLSGMEDASRNDACNTYFKKPCGSTPVSRPPWSGGGGGGQPLRVMVVSYNLYWWNAFGQNPWKSDHIIDNIKNNLKPDSIGLQECDEPGTIRDRTGLERASQFDGAQGIMVKPGLFAKGSSGSRDIQATGKWGPRYVTWVELTDPQSGRTFWHFNTHWCVHNGNGRVCDENVRYRGAQNMLNVIKEKAGDLPVVITGDFNARLNEKGPQHFLANGFQLAENAWVDCIFYSHHWELRRHGTGDASHSDHRPIFAELQLKCAQKLPKPPNLLARAQQVAWFDYLRPSLEWRRKCARLEEELAALQKENALLASDAKWWEAKCSELEDYLRYNWDWWRAKAIRLSSPLTKYTEELSEPQSEGFDWKWYPTSCPCCRRPLDITVSAGTSYKTWDKWDTWDTWEHGEQHAPRCAYVCVVWGANAGYALGAAVLGTRLQELQAEQGGAADLILMHTDDVPQNYLEELSKIWKLQSTEYIDGVPALYTTKGTRFDGVFTKLSAWKLVEYDKVMLLDIDTLPLKPLGALFDLEPPAALVRGSCNLEHGALVDGRSFFSEGGWEPGGWLQSGGINAGVILLRPSQATFEQMLSEVTSEHHPAHIAGNGPEQDYLTRFFAADLQQPWRHIDVSYNFQLHHIPFALEQVVRYRNQLCESQREDSDWLPPRLTINAEDIKLIHFSGELKYWHMLLCDETEVEFSVERFAEKMLAEFASYGAWVTGEEDCEEYGACRCDGRIVLLSDPKKDITDLVARAFQHVRDICVTSCAAWHSCALRLLERQPGLLRKLEHPSVPPGSALPGAEVEVLWPREGEAWRKRWHPARVLGVHSDGSYTVHYYTEDKGWSSCMERNVDAARVKWEPGGSMN